MLISDQIGIFQNLQPSQNHFLGWDFFCRFLQQTGSSHCRCAKDVTRYILIFYVICILMNYSLVFLLSTYVVLYLDSKLKLTVD